MNDGAERDDAGEEVGVFDEGNWELDELGYALCCFDGLCRVDVVGVSGEDALVRGAGCDVSGDARVELRVLTM